MTNKRSPINSNDIRVLSILANSDQLSQRQLAQRAGLSVGMINLLLRRLTLTGYIKIVNLDRRKMRYLLTAKGLAEKTNRSYQYLLRAVQTYRELYERIADFINEKIRQGESRFVIVGSGELAELVKLVLRNEGKQVQFSCVADKKDAIVVSDAVLIHCDINNQQAEGISILEAALGHTFVRAEIKGESYELV